MAKKETAATEAGADAPKVRKKREPVEYVNAAHRFKVLGQKRVSRAVKTIQLIGNLSSSGYEYQPEQVAKIRETLLKAVDAAIARFTKAKSSGPAIEL